jgi:hypothetical protein
MDKMNDFDHIVSRLEDAADKIESSLVTRCKEKIELYRRELSNVVTVLEQTKGSFHSKQLKNLRERLESVLQQEINQ